MTYSVAVAGCTGYAGGELLRLLLQHPDATIATIDVYAVFFILLMYYFMYRYVTLNFFTGGLKKTLVPLGACGLFFGVGAACKWTCIYAGAGLAALLLFVDVGRAGPVGQVGYYETTRKTVLCVLHILPP